MRIKHQYSKAGRFALFSLVLLLAQGCQKDSTPKDELRANSQEASAQRAEPSFNLEVILRGAGKAFGHVTFRQDNDAARVVALDVWVRDLAPNHSYLLQRAVDTNLDGNCTGTAWLTLGKGLTPATIDTDSRGTGRAALFRDLSAIAPGTAFDIHFRIVDAANMAVVLTSGCYRYVTR